MTRERVVVAAVVAACAALAGCPQKQEPTPEDGAAYFGISPGTTLSYTAGALTETHESKTSSLLVDGALVVDLLARQNGFLVDERTFSLAVTKDSLSLVRQFDCVTKCGEQSAPIALFPWPLEGGEQAETTATVELTEQGAPAGSEEQRHSFVVSGETDVEVPAGSFSGFPVVWSKTVGDVVDTARFTVVADTGIVSWDGFDGAELRLQ